MLVDALVAFPILLGLSLAIGLWQGRRDFTFAMLLYGGILSIGVLLSVNDSIAGQGWGTPYLMASDGTGYFEQGRLLAEFGIRNYEVAIRSNYVGYQILLAVLFQISGVSVLAAVLLNVAFLLLATGCVYRATFLLTSSPRAALLASIAMMLTASNIFYALVLLKEPPLALAFALMLLAITKFVHDRRAALSGLLYILIALAIIVTMRATVLLFVFILVLFVAGSVLQRRGYALAVIFAGLLFVAPIAQSFTVYELDAAYLTTTIVQNEVISSRFADGDLDLSGIAGRVIGTYIALPFSAKVALFPVPVVAQILLPFDFWSSIFITDHFASFFSRNLGPLWYMFVFVWVAFSVINIRKIPEPLIRRFLIGGVFYFVVVAVIYGGVIPRYGAPALIFIYPAVGYWWDRALADRSAGRRARDFFTLYYLAAAGAGILFLGFQLLR